MVNSKHSRALNLKTLPVMIALAYATMPVFAEQDSATTLLGTVDVTSQVLGDVTEGTGSYTTGKTTTALPLSTSPRDTPQSIDVLTQQEIQDERLLTITDALNNMTGVFVHQYETNRAQFVSRGFDINALMIDGVPTTWNQSWSSGEVATSLAMYDHVEVVSGATGMMTGAGMPSAAVNLVRKRADSKELTGTLEVGYGSWNQWRGMFDVQTPINESKTVRARVVGEYVDSQSYINLLTNNNQTIYGTVEADLTPNTLLSLGFGQQYNNARGSMWGGLPVWYSNGNPTNWNTSKTTAANWTNWNSQYDNYFATLEHRFENDWKIKASYTFGNRTSNSYLLYLYGAPDQSTGLGMNAWPGSYNVRTRQSDVALQVKGPFELFGQKHELSFGYTYSEQNFTAMSRPATPSFGSATDFNNWNGSYPQPSWGATTFYGNQSTQQEGFYGAGQFNLMDPLHLILGGRFTNYKQSGVDIYSSPYTMQFNQQFTPFAGLTYDLNDNYSVYASYTDIFQPQQYRDYNGNYLKPILGKSYEGGVKSEFYEGRLNASAAVFKIQQENLAQSTGQVIPGTVPPETAYVATTGATSEGFELNMAGQLLPSWNVSAGYTQYHLTDATGNDVNSIYPRDLLRLFNTYRLPGVFHDLTIGGGVNWQSSTYTWATNPQGASQKISQGSYALVNLMARYQFTKQVSAQVNINNVFDKTYYNMFAAYDQFTYGAPLNANFTLRYQF